MPRGTNSQMLELVKHTHSNTPHSLTHCPLTPDRGLFFGIKADPAPAAPAAAAAPAAGSCCSGKGKGKDAKK